MVPRAGPIWYQIELIEGILIESVIEFSFQSETFSSSVIHIRTSRHQTTAVYHVRQHYFYKFNNSRIVETALPLSRSSPFSLFGVFKSIHDGSLVCRKSQRPSMFSNSTIKTQIFIGRPEIQISVMSGWNADRITKSLRNPHAGLFGRNGEDSTFDIPSSGN